VDATDEAPAGAAAVVATTSSSAASRDDEQRPSADDATVPHWLRFCVADTGIGVARGASVPARLLCVAVTANLFAAVRARRRMMLCACAEQLERIFLPFTQEEQSTCRQFGGTGLGLTVRA
jgi:hypothetical protein